MTMLADAARDTARAPTYQLLVDDLKALGVEQVFGLMSDDTAVFATALDSAGIRFYGARHENNAVAMAEGFSYASGQLGIAVIGRGPATANGLHAITYASRSGSKVLIISGDAAVSSGAANGVGPDYKSFNAGGVLAAAGIRTFVATSPETARGVLADAIAAAMQGGASALLLPVNVQLAETHVDVGMHVALPKPRPPAPPRAQAIEAAAALLRQSRKPIILAGLGAHRAGAKAELELLADRIGALLATSARGKDMFRGHPANLGIVGSFSHSAARRMIAEADCVLVFGAGLNLLTMSFGHSLPKVPLIQVDTDRSHIGRWHPADVAV
ncbi:MAG: thiamine pyrophosphate-binding protein, partial [Alphaproteobacteria bacterium]|nr:thiamine pyrophosphate-binding protein [Alphaproteobacteria bacterium]